MISDFANGTTASPGNSAAWYDAAGYQYGPRIYDAAGLAEIPGLAYVNETVTVAPGDELRTIEETQRRDAESVPTPAFFGLFGL